MPILRENASGLLRIVHELEVPAARRDDWPLTAVGFLPFANVCVAEGEVPRRQVIPSLEDRQ